MIKIILLQGLNFKINQFPDGFCLKEVTALWRFEHISSSPLYAQSNGEVEGAVRI